MKTLVNSIWYNQELKALDWQIKNEKQMIPRTQRRIDAVKAGKIDVANCSLDFLENLLEKVKSENGNAEIRKKAFILEYQPDDSIRPDWKGAEAFVKINLHKICGAKMGDQFEYYNLYSIVSQLYGLPPRSDSGIDRFFKILDSALNENTK